MSKYDQFTQERRSKPLSLMPSLIGSDPMHPWHSPEWLRGVQASHPVAFIAQTLGKQGRQLTAEALAAEHWRKEQGHA